MSKTVGEKAFEEYAKRFRYAFDDLTDSASGHGITNPDFRITNTTPTIYVEVEDFDQGPRERELSRQYKEYGEVEWDLSGDQFYTAIREKINHANRQLHRFKGQFPCLLVLFKTPLTRLVEFDSRTILGAMYGNIEVKFSEAGSQAELYINPKRSKLRLHQNTTISAIMTLERILQSPKVYVYHNQYASAPISHDVLCGTNVFVDPTTMRFRNIEVHRTPDPQ